MVTISAATQTPEDFHRRRTSSAAQRVPERTWPIVQRLCILRGNARRHRVSRCEKGGLCSHVRDTTRTDSELHSTRRAIGLTKYVSGQAIGRIVSFHVTAWYRTSSSTPLPLIDSRVVCRLIMWGSAYDWHRSRWPSRCRETSPKRVVLK